MISNANENVEIRFLFSNSSPPRIISTPLSTPLNKLDSYLFPTQPTETETNSASLSNAASEAKSAAPGLNPGDDTVIRMFCMGKELIIKDNAMTLAQINFPRFPAHPTPVHVSIATRQENREENRRSARLSPNSGALQRLAAELFGTGNNNVSTAMSNRQLNRMYERRQMPVRRRRQDGCCSIS